jgi:hypothetical protein
MAGASVAICVIRAARAWCVRGGGVWRGPVAAFATRYPGGYVVNHCNRSGDVMTVQLAPATCFEDVIFVRGILQEHGNERRFNGRTVWQQQLMPDARPRAP